MSKPVSMQEHCWKKRWRRSGRGHAQQDTAGSDSTQTKRGQSKLEREGSSCRAPSSLEHASPSWQRPEQNYVSLRTSLEEWDLSQTDRIGALDLSPRHWLPTFQGLGTLENIVLWFYIGTTLSWLQPNGSLALSSMRGWTHSCLEYPALWSPCLGQFQLRCVRPY